MRSTTIPPLFPLVLLCIFLAAEPLRAADSPREHLSLDGHWKFHLGDDWPDATHLDKAGTGSGPAAGWLASEVTWRSVDLPHDWAVELPFDRAGDGNHGFRPIGPGFERNSVGWYRREFTLPEEDSARRIWLTFDGVYRDATIWVNGWLVRHHEGGYDTFHEDITDVLHFGGKNEIAVRVDATKFEGWFYEGAGIYRHVWLDKTAPVAIAPDGIFVRSEFKNNVPAQTADIKIETNLLNSTTTSVTATVQCEVVSPDGQVVARVDGSASLDANSSKRVEVGLMVNSRELWSPESPKLYKLVETVNVAGKVVDRQDTSFGIRTVGFDPDKGFLLNGNRYEIHGTCNHQDHAGVGIAVPDALWEFRIKRLKEFGCNAIRTAHNPPAPELLDACDRLGMLVMDESRLLGSDSENLCKWEGQLRRDRNHASVAIWSIANEEHAVQDSPQAACVARTMQDDAKRLDPTRPVTYAAPEGNVFRGINSVIEVRGWNYNYGPEMDAYHTQHPSQPNLGTEQASVVGTRGIYTNDWNRGYVSAYDVVWPGWTTTAESWWSYFGDRPWLSGGFVWTGFDYGGEPTPCGWPCVSSHFGILDICGFPKDAFYYYQSWWTSRPVLHLTPHWNWPGKEGQQIRVEAQSNCQQVELFLNGASQGRQSMKRNSKLVWQVKYAPGALSAKGYDDAGALIAETRVETADEPARIELMPDRKVIHADGEDLAVFTVSALDAKGRVTPLAQNKIGFTIEGAGKMIGVGNGDPTCHEPCTFVSTRRDIPIHDWRWTANESSPDSDDSSWQSVKPGEMPVKDKALYRAHITLTKDDLGSDGVYLCFGNVVGHGSIFVNDELVGESKNRWVPPIFEGGKHLHVGENIISVRIESDHGQGGINPDVKLVVAKPAPAIWTRSLFNGLAQVIVQSTTEPGEFKLTATADGLHPATAAVQTKACNLRAAVP